MADVTGDLGGNPIQLNNAATEATLKQILAAMLAMNAMQAKNTKKDITTQKELEAELRRLAQGAKKAVDANKDINKSQKDSAATIDKANEAQQKRIKGLESEVKSAKKVEDGLKHLSTSSKDVVTSLIDMADSLASMQDSISGSVKAFGQLQRTSQAFANTGIPGVSSAFDVLGQSAGVISGIFGAVASNAERLLKNFQGAASVGASFNGSLTTMVRSASEAGLTMEQFTGIIQKNSKNLSMLGGSTAEGAKRLGILGKSMRESGVADQLAALGYSTEEINDNMVNYAASLQRTGALQGMTNEQLVQQTGEYLQNLDAVSRLTGESRKDLEKQRQDRLKDAQFRLTLSKLDTTSQKSLHALMDSIPEEHRKGMMEIVATGSATSEAGKNALRFLPESAKAMMGLNRQINTTGKMTMDQAMTMNKAYQSEANRFMKSGVAENMAKYGTDAQKQFYVGAADAGQRQKTLADTQAEQAKSLEEAKKAEESGQKLTAAEMAKLQRNIAETSNKFSVILATGMPALTKFTDMLLSAANLVAPALEKIAPHLDAVAVGLIAMIAATKIASKIREAKENALAKAMQTRGTPQNPMYVTEGPGGGDGGDGKGKKGKGKPGKLGTMGKALKGAGGLIKGAGVVGAVAGGAMLYSDLKDIDEKVASGEMTPEEAKKAKGGAVGGAAGGAGGAMAGAAAGAAIGSVVPVVGTVIGGLIGGAIGGWLGRKGGEIVGEKVMEGAEKGTAKAPAAATPSPTAVMPGAKPLSQDKTQNLQLVKAALEKQGITDPKMINATLANVMKETGGISKEENLNYKNTSNDRIRSIFGSRAAGKSDAELSAIKSDPKQMGEMMYGAGSKIGQSMGNTEPGDGFKYRGRGFIQLTGKNNYAAASKAIYGDNRLVDNPDMVNDPAVAAQVSAWYMKKTQGSMAKKLGIDTNNMTQGQANLLATSQVAGRAIKPGQGYLGETLAKVDAYSTQTASIAGAPTNAAVGAALAASTPAAAFQTAAASDSMISPEQRAMAQAGKAASVPGLTSGAGAAQETPTSLLSSLNNKMDQLISMNRQLVAVNERQLSVQKNISSNGDLFAAT